MQAAESLTPPQAATKIMAGMAEWRNGGNGGTAERMAEWQNGRNGYVCTIYGTHTHTDNDDTDDDDTLIFYCIDDPCLVWCMPMWVKMLPHITPP